jgi:uncharacterized surface protein with fasciclin (FAS1) repeats
MKKFLALALLALFVPAISYAAAVAAPPTPEDVAQDPEAAADAEAMADEEAPPSEEADDIVSSADMNPSLSTFNKLLAASGLADTLKGEGPFTVFAPRNEAFDALKPGTVDTLLKPENKDDLISLLSYHVLSGAVTSSDIKDASEVASLQGKPVKFTKTKDGIKIDDANVVTSDIPAANGVIHTIDKVISP